MATKKGVIETLALLRDAGCRGGPDISTTESAVGIIKAWMLVLDDVDDEALVESAKLHLRDSSPNYRGEPRCRWFPEPGVLRGGVASQRGDGGKRKAEEQERSARLQVLEEHRRAEDFIRSRQEEFSELLEEVEDLIGRSKFSGMSPRGRLDTKLNRAASLYLERGGKVPE